MNDTVVTLLVEREQMDRGFPAGVVLSIAAHLILVGGSVLAAILGPRPPLIQTVDGFTVALPPGGGGSPNAAPPAPAQPEPAPVTTPPEPPKREPAPKILKPPKQDKRKGLPEPDTKHSKKKPEAAPAPRTGVPVGTATSAGAVGVLGPVGPGLPSGTDLLGDWYMAGILRKVTLLWAQQIRPEATQEVTIVFTIVADGSVEDIDVARSSGISLLDRAAQRAILSAAPFGPLPRSYGTNRYTVQFVFRPAS